MLERELAIFTPIPPEQNGIADYAYHLITALSNLAGCAVYANQPDGVLPAGVAIREPAQAFRYLRRDNPILHQVGNNPGHIFVLEALRKWGGLTTLHDQSLHYLYEASLAPKSLLMRNMRGTSEKMGAVFARHWFEQEVKTGANYALFDMLDEVLTLSSSVIVHSRFAKNRIRLLHGAEVAARVHVVPHLALPPNDRTDDYLHGTLKIPTGMPLIVTSGFATGAKRFDWLVEALDEIARRGVEFFWLHAGKERPDEYDLSGLLSRYPAVQARCMVSGYLSEPQLNECVAACDILVNLRFPSVGESSGTLARAMAAGRCCVVNATAAYTDLPPDTVMHVPVSGAVPALVEGLLQLLANPELRAAFGDKALALARGEWAPEAVARQYIEIIAAQDTQPRQPARRRAALAQPLLFPIDSTTLKEDIAQQTRGCEGKVEIWLTAGSAEHLAAASLRHPRLFEEVLPHEMQLRAVNVQPAPASPHEYQSQHHAGVALALKGIFA